MKRTSIPAFSDRNVAKVFDAYPEDIRARLVRLRGLIFDTAKNMEEVGPLEETLKWGQPSYLTTESGSGSTIRIGREKADGRIAMYFHCQTDLVATFRDLYPTQMTYGGNRSILFEASDRILEKALRHCIGLALTYHARKSAVKSNNVPVRKPASRTTPASARPKAAALKPRARQS
ncbi:hypothetical protein CSIRO_0646 [Bradyrhizobiaceae bacterium SG-6C]|nr:hypothetical protein CSIRO_0646 [Bradyrhizobiaceae bacterium SG-6C]